MVAVLTHALGVIRRDIFKKECDPERLATAALYHDSSEILTGDLPTPIKYHSREIREAYHQVEALACEKLLRTLPTEMQSTYEPLLAENIPERDKLSAYIKCIEERKAGNNEFVSAEKQTLEALKSYGLIEVEYFLEHFMSAFELNLDELGTIDP